MEKKEIRVNTELRALDGESRTIEGYAIRFDEWSVDLGGFYEIIRPTAITQELVDASDIIMNIDHDNERLLARSKQGKGTLQLELRADGLYFKFDAPATANGDELLFNVRAGNLTECSFAFSVGDAPDDDRWYRDEQGTLRREINFIKGLYDTSIVVKAAYPTTSVSARSQEVMATVSEVDKIMDGIDEKFKNL